MDGRFTTSRFFLSDIPQSYIYRMVAMDFRRVFSEAPIDIDLHVKDELSPEDCTRLNRVKSSLLKLGGFKDKLPEDEMEEMIQEEARRNQVRRKRIKLAIIEQFSNECRK